jgi:mannose-6-phosphate isomerase-like protein (cupin superfamily)
MQVRRVVTGHRDGRAVVVADGDVEPITLSMIPGVEFFEVWSEKGPRFVPQEGPFPDVPRFFPDSDEVVFRFVTIPAGASEAGEAADRDADLQEAIARVPRLVDHLEPENPGMHTTDSVDFGIVVSGEVHLELDNGAEVLLAPGSCVVQNGTRHAWRNRSSEPALIAFVLLGATRRA